MKKLLIALFMTCLIVLAAGAFPIKVKTDQKQPETIFFKWNVMFELEDARIQIVLDPLYKDTLEGAPKLTFNKALSVCPVIVQEGNIITLAFDVLSTEMLDFQIEWKGNAAYFTNVHARIEHSKGDVEGSWHLWSPNKSYD